MPSITQGHSAASPETLPPFMPDPQDEAGAESLLRQYLPRIVSDTYVENHLRELMSLEGGFVDRLNYISSRIPEYAKTNLLISGCAAGSEMLVARKFGYQRICGTEVVQELVAICKQRLSTAPGFEVVHYDGMRLPHPDRSFSMIMSGHIIEHTSSPYHYLLEHMRVLHPGGWMFLEFPNRYHLTELHTGLPSVEYLPWPMRALALRWFASRLSPFAEQNRVKYRTIRLKLKPVSIWQVRTYLRRMKMGDARIMHHYKPAAGYVRMLIQK